MPELSIVVIGASAGGVEALQKVVRHLEPDLPAAVFVVMHVPAHSESLLPGILSRRGPLSAKHPKDGETIVPGQIYVAPPDCHMVVGRGHVHLNSGPKEQHHRPCINITFRSAVAAYGPRVIGVVLSGELDDGTAGLWQIKQKGGIAVVQNPEDATYPSMPLSALKDVEADYTPPVEEIGPLLNDLCQRQATSWQQGRTLQSGGEVMQEHVTDLTCPECRGTLWEVRRGRSKDYRCRVGHTYSEKSMLAQHLAAQETALYMALVALEEGLSLFQRAAADSTESDAAQIRQIAEKRARHVEALRRIVSEAHDLVLT